MSLASSAWDLSGARVGVFVFTIPAWAAERVMQSLTRLTVQLAARAGSAIDQFKPTGLW